MAASALQYDELMVGFDGPAVEKPGVIVIDNANMLKEHWISEKLGAKKIASLIEEIDFSSQFILVAQVGIRNTATGNMNIAEIEFDETKENVVVYIRVGVNERECEIPKRQSLPYAISVIDKPEVWPTLVNYYIGNFGDGCKQPRGTQIVDI
jgi:hypothetical protein